MIEYLNSQPNTIYLKGIDGDQNPFDVPFCLTKLKGGVNAYDTADAIKQSFIDVIDLKKDAYTEIV